MAILTVTDAPFILRVVTLTTSFLTAFTVLFKTAVNVVEAKILLLYQLCFNWKTVALKDMQQHRFTLQKAEGRSP